MSSLKNYPRLQLIYKDFQTIFKTWSNGYMPTRGESSRNLNKEKSRRIRKEPINSICEVTSLVI